MTALQDAPPACAGGCGEREGLSAWLVEGCAVWLCAGCLRAVVAGPAVASGVAARPFTRGGET